MNEEEREQLQEYRDLYKSHKKYIEAKEGWLKKFYTIPDVEGTRHLDIGWAEAERTALFLRMHTFMEQYEFIVCPVTQVPPFDVRKRFISEINGVKMDSFIDWMKSCYYITVTGHPAISVPCGFTTDGLPVGIQIVGRYRDDFGVLQLAKAFEDATQYWQQLPPILSS